MLVLQSHPMFRMGKTIMRQPIGNLSVAEYLQPVQKTNFCIATNCHVLQKLDLIFGSQHLPFSPVTHNGTLDIKPFRCIPSPPDDLG